jgi:thiamine-phosphate pyrophosphorylase
MSENFKLIVLTPEKEIEGESESIAELFEAGMQLLHVRKPEFTIGEMRQLLNAIPSSFHPRIIVHSHYELQNDFNIKGIHLPEKIRKEGTTGNLKNIISTSFHKLEDIVSTRLSFEYTFYSPVFNSISKERYKPKQDLIIIKDFLTTNKNFIKFPVIALGGITDRNILQAKSIGFNGAGCIGYIWDNPNPVEQFRTLQKSIES